MENQKTDAVPTWEAILVIVATFFVFLFVSAAVLLTFGDAPALVVGELLILIVPLSYLLLKRIDIRSYVGISGKPKFILIGLACGAALLLLNIAVSAALTYIFGVSKAVEESNALLSSLSSSPSGLIAVVTSLALAGVCEEFAFRGFLQNMLNRRYSFLPAIIVSAAIFGFFHFDLQLVYTLAAFISGLALGYIYHRWNYVTSATAHATMNLIVLALLLLGV